MYKMKLRGNSQQFKMTIKLHNSFDRQQNYSHIYHCFTIIIIITYVDKMRSVPNKKRTVISAIFTVLKTKKNSK